MYFCKNLLLLWSLSCSSRTASIRLKIVRRESCNAFACLIKVSDGVGKEVRKQTHFVSSSRACLPILSMSSLVLRGLMALTSSGPKWASIGPTAELSRGTTKGPLLLRLGNRGRVGIGWWIVISLSDPAEAEESERPRESGLGGPEWLSEGDSWSDMFSSSRVVEEWLD